MKRLIQMIDLHIIVLGGIVSAIFVGLVSTITFVPGTPQLTPSLVTGLVPLLVFLEPSIITRTMDQKKMRGSGLSYFVMNTLVTMLYGAVCGLLIFGMLPRTAN